MPFRAYARIWNEWFRDENLQQPVVQDTDDANNTGSNTGNQLTDAQNGGLPLKVAKYHDYFTSCLPEPQKGEASTIPISLDLGSIPSVGGSYIRASIRKRRGQPRSNWDLWDGGGLKQEATTGRGYT